MDTDFNYSWTHSSVRINRHVGENIPIRGDTIKPHVWSFPIPGDNSSNRTGDSNIKESDMWPLLAAITVCLSLLTTAFNLGIIASYIVRTRIRLVLGVFVFNLCLVDFLNGCIALPLTVIYPRGSADIWGRNLSGPACVFITFWPTSLVVIAYLSIVLVTTERFVAILFPMTFYRIVTTARCIAVVIAIWAYSIIYTFAPAFAIELDPSDPYDYIEGCHGLYVYSQIYMDFFLIGILCLPLIFVIVMYMTMYFIARKHLKAIAAVTLPDPMRNQKDKRLLHHSKAAKTTFIMTSIFLVCWLPFLIIMLLSDICNFDTCPEFTSPQALMIGRIATTCLAFVNSAINPWIYGYRNPIIKRELKAMFCMSKRTSVVSVIDTNKCVTKKLSTNKTSILM